MSVARSGDISVHFPADSLTVSPMEFVEQPRSSGAGNLLVPGFSCVDVDDEDGEMVIAIRPKSSPLPRRRTSFTDEESESELPPSGFRRVSFADAKGLRLVQVKEFDQWDVPKLPGYESSDGKGKDAEEYFLSPLTFPLLLSTKDLSVKVQEQKVELETIELLPGTTTLKGVVRVLNISFNKAVYVRTTLDTWSSHFDLLAEHIPGSSTSLMDSFSFKLTLVPPFGEQGARVDFCLRYETPVGTFWANNNNENYVLVCHQRMKEQREKSQRENINMKSCLKTVSQNFSSVEDVSALKTLSQKNIPPDASRSEEIQITDGKISTTETQSRRPCSRSSRRRAARMARVKDIFAQREGVMKNESEASTHDAKEEIKETAVEECSHVQSFSDGNSKSEGSPLASQTPLPPQVDTCDSLEKHTDSADPLGGGDTATDVRVCLLQSEDVSFSTGGQNTTICVSAAEETHQNRGECCGCGDSIISADTNESIINQTSSVTFGTVVAPLYHQVFSRVGSESHSLRERGNPACTAQCAADCCAERSESSSSVSTDSRRDEPIEGNMIKESNQERLDATLNVCLPEKEQNILTAADNGNSAGILQDSDKRTDRRSRNMSPLQPAGNQTLNICNEDLLDGENLGLQGRTQEDILPCDLRHPAGEGTDPAQPPKQTCTQSETQVCQQIPQNVSRHVGDDVDHQTSRCETTATGDESKTGDGQTVLEEEDKALEALHDLKHSDHPANETSCVSSFEPDVRSPETSQETPEKATLIGDDMTTVVHGDKTNHSAEFEVSSENAESTTNAMTYDDHTRGEMLFEAKDETKEHLESKAAISEKKLLSELRNWEMMVEEEERNIFTDKEDKEAEENIINGSGMEYNEATEDEGESNTEFTQTQSRERVEEDVDKEDTRTTKTDRRAGEEEVKEETGEERNGEEKKEEENQRGNVMETDHQENGEISGDDQDNVRQIKPQGQDTDENPEQEPEANQESGYTMKTEDGSSAVAYNVHKGNKLINKEETEEDLSSKFSNWDVSHDESKADREQNHFPALETLWTSAGEPESDQSSGDSASDESNSDDEVELYMHCLRAVHTGVQPTKDQGKESGFGGSKRSSLCRGRPLSAPMPSISESQDEEQPVSSSHGDTEAADVRLTAAVLPRGHQGISRSNSWWRETFSWTNISRTLLCATLLVLFLVVAYYYDFFACVGLYLISVVWLWCQERPADKTNRKS